MNDERMRAKRGKMWVEYGRKGQNEEIWAVLGGGGN